MALRERMTHPFTEERLREIIAGQIERDENLGSQSGSSGHLGYVESVIDGIDAPLRSGGVWKVTYRYTVIVTTEFTIYPDNPPQESGYEKTITVDDGGNIVSEGERRFVSTNWGPEWLPDPAPGDERSPEVMVQRVIDLETGKDITAEYISQRLKELETLADSIIRRAKEDVEAAPGKRRKTYETANEEIHERLGMGSIGPATATAAPLMGEKKWELAEALGIDETERIY